jgi:hypothetical protein
LANYVILILDGWRLQESYSSQWRPVCDTDSTR